MISFLFLTSSLMTGLIHYTEETALMKTLTSPRFALHPFPQNRETSIVGGPARFKLLYLHRN